VTLYRVRERELEWWTGFRVAVDRQSVASESSDVRVGAPRAAISVRHASRVETCVLSGTGDA